MGHTLKMPSVDIELSLDFPDDSDPSRNVSGLLKRLEDSPKGVDPSRYIFNPSTALLRDHLSFHLKKLIFKNIVENGLANDMILWENVVYHPIHIGLIQLKKPKLHEAKRFHQKFFQHIDDSVGIYKSILARLQNDYFRSDIWPESWAIVGIQRISSKDSSLIDADESRVAAELAEKCLSYLGDLYSYRTKVGDFYSRAIASSYYQMLIRINPDNGLGHYKLGVMDIGRAFRINAVFHFLHSLAVSQPYAPSKDKLLYELNQNESRFLDREKSNSLMPTLESYFERRREPLKLKDLRFTALRFLEMIFLNTRYHFCSKKSLSSVALDDDLLTEVVSDVAFILKSESRRYGSKYIKGMLPIPKRLYNGVPDFCPDPEKALLMGGTTTSLLPAIIMRIISIIILSNELLLGSNVDDKIRKENVKVIFEKAKQLPQLLLNILDFLLIYSFRSLAKSTNMFTLSAAVMIREVYGEDDDDDRTYCGEDYGVFSEGRKAEEKWNEGKEGEEEASQKVKESEGDLLSVTTKESINELDESVEVESEGLTKEEDEEGSSDDYQSDDTDFGRLRGHRLRRLRARCHMIDEDDVIDSSSSEYSYVDEEEDDDDPYHDSEDDDDEHSEFNLPEEEEEIGNGEGGGDQYPAYDDFDVEIDEEEEEEEVKHFEEPRTSENLSGKSTDELAKVRLLYSTPDKSCNGVEQNGDIGSNAGSDNDEESEESDESDCDYETSSDHDEEDADAYYGPTSQPRVWLRLFVASFFVDNFIAGIKLIIEWLLTVRYFLKEASIAHPLLLQRIVSHFASVINYLNPIVALAKKESESNEIMKGRYRGLPIHYIHSTTPEILPHVSSQCREMLKREFEGDKKPKSQPPLTEEWLIRGSPTMSIAFNTVDFDAKPLKNRIEQTLVKCVKLTMFGHELCKLADELRLKFEYHKDVDYFLAPLPSDEENSESSSLDTSKHSYRKNRKKTSNKIKTSSSNKPNTSMDVETMRNLAKRRLENEVADLSNVKPSKKESEGATNELNHLSQTLPHIVIDSYCLISNSVFMSRLLKSKSAVIVVPSKVVKHLDQLKKTTAAARSATRILEEGQTTCIRIQGAAETPEGSIQLRLGGANLNADENVENRVVSTDSGPVNFGVLYRWANIIECSIYFAARKKKVSFFKGAEIDVGKSVELVNVLEFQSTLPEIENPTISVVINTKAAPAEELKVPAEFVKIAHGSGVIFESLHKFSRRWRFSEQSQE